MDYSIKVMLPKLDRKEYVTTVHVKQVASRELAISEALNYVRRAQWLSLSDIEKTKLIFEVKTIN